MAYGSEIGVEAIVPGGGAIGVSSTPTSTQLAVWLASGASRIDRVLASAGYAVPVLAAADVYEELQALNDLYAAAFVLRARGLAIATGLEQDQATIWLAEFASELQDLAASNLVAAGVPLATTTTSGKRRIRSVQTRRIDGYSAQDEDAESAYDYPSV